MKSRRETFPSVAKFWIRRNLESNSYISSSHGGFVPPSCYSLSRYINRAILDGYWKSPCLHAGCGKRLPGLDVEFPSVPRTPDDFIFAVIDEFCPADGCRGSALCSLAQRSPAMRANVQQCVKTIPYSKYADRQLADLGDPGHSNFDFLSATDKGFLCHCQLSLRLHAQPWSAECVCKLRARSAPGLCSSTLAECEVYLHHHNPNVDSRTQTARCFRHPSLREWPKGV